MHLLAMLFGIFFLLRKSEFLDETPTRSDADGGASGAGASRTKKSPATRRFVIFYDKEGREIPYEKIGITRVLASCSTCIEASPTSSARAASTPTADRLVARAW